MPTGPDRDVLAHVVAGSRDPMALTRVGDSIVVAVNEAFAALVGRPRTELLGRRMTETGAWPAVEARAAELPMSVDGEPHVLTIGGDICEQVVADQAQRLSEQRMRDVLMTVKLPTVVLDTAGRIIFMNAAHAAWAGMEPEELEGRLWLDVFVVPDARGDRDRAYPVALGRGEIADYTAPVLTHTGEERMIQWHNVVLRTAAGDVYGSASIGADVTEQTVLQVRLKDSERRRERVLAELLRVEAEERARIATDLHDDSVQVMVATLLTLDRLVDAARAGVDDAVAARALEARELLAAAVERTRRLTFELRPAVLEADGIAGALRFLVDQACADTGWACDVDVTVGRHEPELEQLVYRTVREAVVNARKHARASRIEVAVCDDDGAIRGRIADDGHGFELDTALAGARASAHLGLDTMIERVRLAGGSLTVRTRPGEGTEVVFTIPIAVAS